MDELDKGLSVAYEGPDAERAVARIHRQVEAWGLRLPDVSPLVLDFGLNDFYSTGETEFWIANEGNAGYCGKFLFVFKDQLCPLHHHERKLETFFIVRGKVEMSYLEKQREMANGDVLRVAPGEIHGFRGLEPTLLLEVSMPSIIDDNFFEDSRIPIGGNYRPGQ